jgi:hypothetical protein
MCVDARQPRTLSGSQIHNPCQRSFSSFPHWTWRDPIPGFVTLTKGGKQHVHRIRALTSAEAGVDIGTSQPR